jgi:transglutaminase-like putative cysteine protease
MASPRRIKFILSVAAPAFVFLSLGATPAPAADTAPDWLRQAAQQMPPEYDKETVAVVLLDEIQNTVRENGEIDVRHRQAIRLLRPEARREYGDVSVPFDKDTKISSLKAWTIEANGQQLAVGEKDSIEHGYVSDFEYYDTRVKTLEFPEANPGNVIGYEYVQRKRPYIFEDRWAFQHQIPVQTARFILDLPTGWEFTARWFNYAERKPQVASNEYSWELHDLAAVEVEPEMPPWRSVAGWAGIKYFPSNPTLRAKTSGTWNDIGVWYNSLTQSSRVASPQIQQKVAELTSGISDPLQKIRVLSEYVQRNIRYMAVEIGIGGYQPHPASEVFAHQFGDCKDKATLLSSMLEQIGIESYYLVVDTDRGFIFPDYPSIAMDHVVLAIHLPDAASDGGLGPLMRDPKLGRLLIFDPTNEYVPLGDLPWYLQSNYGLLVTPEGGSLVPLPLLAPSMNRLLRTGQFQLSAEGDLSGEVRELEWGAPASAGREEFLEGQASKRAEVFERFLGNYLNNFALTGATLGNLEKYDQPLGLSYKFVARGYANATGDLLLLRPRVLGDESTEMLDLFAEKKARKYAIQFEEATQQSDTFDIALPAGYVPDGLPDPVQVDCGYASYKSRITVSGGMLHYERTFVIKDVMVPTGKLPQVRDFLQQIAADQEAATVLRRATP